MPNITVFDPAAHHIRLSAVVTSAEGAQYTIRAILDTGAPSTEFSDQFLSFAGFIPTHDPTMSVSAGLQTKKYGRVILPHLQLCGHDMENLRVYVSHYEKSWGVDALIGLDFFRAFRVTIDYAAGQIVTEPHRR